MASITQTISTLPNPPSKDDPDHFDSETDRWIGHGSLFQSELNIFGDELNEIKDKINAVAPETYKAKSSSSVSIGKGSKAFVLIVPSGTISSFAEGNSVKIAKTSDPTNYYMIGKVTSFPSALIVDVTVTSGSGTYTGWSISVIPEGDAATFESKTYDEAMATVHLINYQNLGGSC